VSRGLGGRHDRSQCLRSWAWAAVAVGIAASLALIAVGETHHAAARPAGHAVAARGAAVPGAVRQTDPGQVAGTFIPAITGTSATVPVARLASHMRPAVAPLRRLLPADVLVVAPKSLPAHVLAAVWRLPGVVAAERVEAARVRLNGHFLAVLGVRPSGFREFAAKPTAESTALWQGVADGGIAVSYLMGKQERLPLGGTVALAGSRTERLRVAGFGTVGIAGVDGVVTDQVARSLGMPSGNAIVISAPHAWLPTLISELRHRLPAGAAVVPLVAQAAPTLPATTGSAGGTGITATDGPGLTAAQTRAFLAAALSRIGRPYVWGGSGPDVFDCSGLVQWSMRQAGIIMPRVAADQARTGPLLALTDLRPGDLLFYHTDPTAPSYISHVAIYLGNGEMVQAPEPGMDVEVVPAVFGGGFAGAVRVYPRVAAAAAAQFAAG
jgi:peptidoglycan DL-endopeptidase CwlO